MILKIPQNGRLKMIVETTYLAQWPREMKNIINTHKVFFLSEG